jgi:hypothetical protein
VEPTQNFLRWAEITTEATYIVKSNTDVVTHGPCTCHSFWSTRSSTIAISSYWARSSATAIPSSPKDKEASQQPLPSSPTPKGKEALQLPSPPTETEALKDKEASPVKVMPSPPSHTINPPPSSPYDTIHQDLGLYKTMTHLDPTYQFFKAMKNLKSPPETNMSVPAQHVETYMRTQKIELYEEDGEVYNREKLLVRPHDSIFMKEHVPENFVFCKPFFPSAQFSKRLFPLKRHHN